MTETPERDARPDDLRTRMATARDRVAARRTGALRALGIGAVAILVCAGGVLAFRYSDLPDRIGAFLAPPAEAPQTAAGPQPDKAEADDPGPRAPAEPQAQARRSPAKPEPRPPKAPPAAPDAAERERVDQALRALAATPQSEWTEAERERVATARDRAIEARRDGDPHSALRLLGTALRTAAEATRQAERRFRLGLDAARDAYATGDAPAAEGYVADALARRPDSREALDLQARIRDLPELLSARERAANARAAGALGEERDAVRRVAALDPGDAAAPKRLREIDAEIAARRFAARIREGEKAVERADLGKAAAALAAARKLRPRHADTARLKERVATLELREGRTRHLADGRRAAAQDNWQAALDAWKKASALDPSHADVTANVERAGKVLAAQRRLDGFLGRPHRLATPEVAAAAGSALRESAELAALSPRIGKARADLERAIETATTPVPVRVVSDNITEIGIRGVGHIGRTTERVVELRPGAYTFEGRRAGYRTRLIRVEVRPGTPVRIRVVCHERS